MARAIGSCDVDYAVTASAVVVSLADNGRDQVIGVRCPRKGIDGKVFSL